ncbi:MAG TPA: right-handed parallel beta-helix repeat-containing protein [Ignavibacteriaceae bacterium]|nr:right-handed parallel beta-helix repeat-containing protein [Ignavibacteriaceae bacterium]
MKKSFLVLLFLLMPSLSLAGNYYANLNGSATNGGGTWTTAIRLDSFPWWLLQPGDIVNIDGGSSGSEIVYEVTLPLDYYNVSGSASGGYITIRKGVDAGHNGKVILDGYVSGYPPDDYNIDMDYCSYIKIEGLTIRDAAKDNISALNVSNCIIYNCIILDAEWDNINFNEAVDCTVSTCSLHITGVKPSGADSKWSANGINATNCSRLLIENNTITCDVHDNGVGHQIDLIKIGGFKNVSTSNQDGHVIRSNTLVNSNEYDPGHDDCIQVYTDCDTKLYRGDANYPNILQIYRNWIQTTQNQDWIHPDDLDLVDETNAGVIISGDYIDDTKDIGQNIKIEVWSNIFKGYWGKNSVSITNMQPQ